MSLKAGDKVTVKSKEWYDTHVNFYGVLQCGDLNFTPSMKGYCGCTMTVKSNNGDRIKLKEDAFDITWTEGMFEAPMGSASSPAEEIKFSTVYGGPEEEAENPEFKPRRWRPSK